ncbi:unnamed protein product [Phytophthora fragariaefolia]|uniref:Unnamed protein product n=1 Tax=Phytophthora fragariaefolia TaxID=1490495 RepID=A0A9W6Y6Y4_9STRA|nr:unnamed protein product [Phytophthora fragariaefolia]
MAVARSYAPAVPVAPSPPLAIVPAGSSPLLVVPVVPRQEASRAAATVSVQPSVPRGGDGERVTILLLELVPALVVAIVIIVPESVNSTNRSVFTLDPYVTTM